MRFASVTAGVVLAMALATLASARAAVPVGTTADAVAGDGVCSSLEAAQTIMLRQMRRPRS